MSLQLHRPDERGVLKPEPAPAPDYREQLRSPRWGLALRRRAPAGASTTRRCARRRASCAVMFWVEPRRATFVLLVLGYGIGLWHFPA